MTQPLRARAARRPAVPWLPVLAALAVSAAGTIVLGGALFALQNNVWWIALGGVVSLVAGGVYLGWRTREPEPLYGAVLAILYYAIVAAGILIGALADWLPDPLPGLAIGDSTFFFVWPLLQLVAAVVGTVIGPRLARPGEGRAGV